MHRKLRILLASRSRSDLDELAANLEPHGRFKLELRHIVNGHADPLHGLAEPPDVVVFKLNELAEQDLTAIDEAPVTERPPMIIIADGGDTNAMRMAMRVGARDFLVEPASAEDLLASIERVSSQLVTTQREEAAELTAVVNAKGGSGATFIACNLAHICVAVAEQKTALLSLDLQFDSLAPYFDTTLRHGLMQVLENVESLDAVAMDAYMTQHDSGLRILGATPEDFVACHEDRAGQLDVALNKMMANYDQLIVDIPRRIDPLTARVLEHATRIVLVVQQTLSHLQDATRMLDLFRSYGVATDQVLVVVNRYEKNGIIDLADIQKALGGAEVLTVPSNFKLVAESINLGKPMYDHARSSAVTKALVTAQSKLSGQPEKGGAGLFGKAFSSILGKESWLRTQKT